MTVQNKLDQKWQNTSRKQYKQKQPEIDSFEINHYCMAVGLGRQTVPHEKVYYSIAFNFLVRPATTLSITNGQ